MARTKTYTELILLAQEYGVEKNALFVAAARQYEIQKGVIDKMKVALKTGEPIVTKEYVKGRQNITPHPVVMQLPKHVDSMNRTLATMLDIIVRLGERRPPEDKLSGFIEEHGD